MKRSWIFLSCGVVLVVWAGCSSDESTFGTATSNGATSASGGNGSGGAVAGPGSGGTATGGAGTAGSGTGGAGTGGAGDCTCDPNQQCDSQLGCVDCLDNGDCPDPASPICFQGSCEECGTNADCDSTQYCHPNDHTCEPGCQSSTDCTMGNADICDTATGTCVECLLPSDCPNDELCNTALGLCVECILDTDCMNTDNPVCDVTEGQCVECLFNSQCNGRQCVDKECGG